ncbi:hypothetical protein LTR41_004761 [Exophiala xenobiotica]|nr:hypothetical protein LTR41_004761 [Exophiala xenobiotica]
MSGPFLRCFDRGLLNVARHFTGSTTCGFQTRHLSRSATSGHRCQFWLKNATKTTLGPQQSTSRLRSRQPRPKHLLAIGSGILSLVLFSVFQPEYVEYMPATAPKSQHRESESVIDKHTLPTLRLSQVKEHGPSSEAPWIVYEDKVYDITDWIPAHPGGEIILRAAGGSIEPYWDIFSIHKTQYVRDILDQYVVGRLHDDDLVDGRPMQDQIQDPFSVDPERDRRLRFLTQKPCNAETPGDELANSFLTSNETFYIRNHMWVPMVENPEADKHEITIELPDGDSKLYTIGDLKARFKQHLITAALQCSGNRRKDMTDHANKTNGLQWTAGAMSCAEWEGVLLRDVLEDAGLSLDEPGKDAQHVQFSAMEAYGVSIPLATAIDPQGDVLLAFKMNGKPLPRDHGFPVRAVVPGHVAARSVKWVNKIVVSDEESNTTWQRRDYKCFGPNEKTQDWEKYKAIQEMPVTSAITRVRQKPASDQSDSSPSDCVSESSIQGTCLDPNGAYTRRGGEVVELEGYAYSGGGHEIQRVDVSLDGGKTWDQARLMHEDAHLERGSKAWCWKRWRYEGIVTNGGIEDINYQGVSRQTTFVVKATDDAYNTQPERYQSIYNLRGNLSTAWHRVNYSISPDVDRTTDCTRKETV